MSRGKRATGRWTVPGLCLLSLVSVAGVVWLPAAVSFVGAVAAACGWCVWLERHPDPDDDVDKLVDVITRSAQIGRLDDDYVSVIPVEHRYEIRTGRPFV